jgi:oligopeptide transport system permease protein
MIGLLMKNLDSKKKLLVILYFLFLFLGVAFAKMTIDPDFMDANSVLEPPSSTNLFGTDYLGRDYFYQVMMGSVISQLVGFVATFGLLTVAVVFVLFLRWTPYAGLRSATSMLLDIFQCLPSFVVNTVLALFFLQLLKGNFPLSQTLFAIIISISMTFWMNPARLLSSKLTQIFIEPFIEGAIAIGANSRWIYLTHVLPHLRGTFVLLFFIYFPQSILQETILSFIGLGVQSPYSSWGSLMQQGFGNLQTHPHLMLFPAGMVFVTMMVFQLAFKSE